MNNHALKETMRYIVILLDSLAFKGAQTILLKPRQKGVISQLKFMYQ